MVPNDATITLSASLRLGCQEQHVEPVSGMGEKSHGTQAGGGGEVDWPVLIYAQLF